MAFDRKTYSREYLKSRYKTDTKYREKMKAKSRAYHADNPGKRAEYDKGYRRTERCRRSIRKSRQRGRRLVNFMKRGGCSTCPEKRYACLDFHHRDPGTKMADVGRMLADHRPLSCIFAEIQKCDLLCSNCHRCIHHAD